LDPKMEPQPTMRLPAETVMVSALLPMGINYPNFDNIFEYQTNWPMGERKQKYDKTNKETHINVFPPPRRLYPGIMSASDGYMWWNVIVYLPTKFVSDA